MISIKQLDDDYNDRYGQAFHALDHCMENDQSAYRLIKLARDLQTYVEYILQRFEPKDDSGDIIFLQYGPKD